MTPKPPIKTQSVTEILESRRSREEPHVERTRMDEARRTINAAIEAERRRQHRTPIQEH